jgi:hypothetical protein
MTDRLRLIHEIVEKTKKPAVAQDSKDVRLEFMQVVVEAVKNSPGNHDQSTHNPHVGTTASYPGEAEAEGNINKRTIEVSAHEAEIEAGAKKIIEKAKQIEPEITKNVTDVCKNLQGKMEGLDFRLKSEKSLNVKIYEKMMEDESMTVEDAMADIRDSVRYTMTFNAEQFRDKCKDAVAALKANGYEVVKIKNYFKHGDGTYKGVNCNFSKNGQVFELQFHTPESYDIKQNKSHIIYDQLKTAKNPTVRQKLTAECKAFWNSIKEPAGCTA